MMGVMPQKRNAENKGFPPRWRALHGAIYYRVPKGLESQWDGKKLYRLGSTPSEAYTTWAAKIDNNIKGETIGQILDRYALQVIPTKAPRSQVADKYNMPKLRAVLGDMLLGDLEPRHVYQYVDKCKGKVSGKRQIALLSHAFTKAVEWGYISKHPFKGEVRLEGEKPRTRYVEDWEILECLGLSAFRKAGSVIAIQAYIRLKLLTGLRRGDLLRLQIKHIGVEGIEVTTNKTGKAVIYEWDDNLRTAISMAKAARPVDISPYLFCNKLGAGYIEESTGEASGWDSMWQRFMERVKAETKVKERFTEHDLRAKCGSDADSLEHARQLLAHADTRMTDRAYRRKAERVKPGKGVQE